MTSSIPVPCKDSEVTSRVRERDRDSRAAVDSDGSIPTGSLVEAKGREVVEATNLVFSLEDVSEVFSWWNWAGCPWHSIFP